MRPSLVCPQPIAEPSTEYMVRESTMMHFGLKVLAAWLALDLVEPCRSCSFNGVTL